MFLGLRRVSAAPARVTHRRLCVLVGEIRNQIDGIWDDFWSGGVANPLAVMEQITYLL